MQLQTQNYVWAMFKPHLFEVFESRHHKHHEDDSNDTMEKRRSN